MKKHKNLIILIVLFLLICVVASVLYLHFSDTNIPWLDTDSGAVKWEGEQNLQHNTSASNNIAIPGFESLVFTSGQSTQKVNFYNPEENSCLFQLELYADDTLLWKSGYIEPGKGYYTIELIEPLITGTYNGRLHYDCYLADGTALNSANVALQIYVQEEN